MKRIFFLTAMAIALVAYAPEAQAQGFLKGLADRAKERFKEKIENKVETSVDNAMDNVLNGKKSKKSKKSKAQESDDEEYYYNDSESTSSAAADEHEESSYEEADNSTAEEESRIARLDLTDWLELSGIAKEGVHQIALIPESMFEKVYGNMEEQLTGDVQEQFIKRNLNEHNKRVISEWAKKVKSYSIGNRLYSAVDFLDNSDLIVVSTSQEPVSDVRNVRGEWGVIDKNGKVVIPLKHYQFSRDASKMDALMFVDKKGGKVGAYHLDGRLRIPFEHEYINPARTKHKKWFVTTDEKGKNALYDENMNLKLTADNIEIVFGTLNGKDDTYIYTYNGAGSAKVYKNYDENLNLVK